MGTAVAQSLHCRTFGQGPRRVLALHCTIAHSGAWRGLAEAMAEEATFTAPDMLCHGHSPDWDGQGDFHDRMTAAIGEILTEPMDLVGHSFGATLALRIAAERPDLVRSLTLIESVHFAVVRDENPEIVRQAMDHDAPFLDAASRGDYETAARLFNRGWGVSYTRWDDLSEKARAAMTRGVRIVPACSPAIMDDRPGLLRADVLDRVDMPVLLLRGSDTPPIIGAVNDVLARRLANADNIVVEGAGHMLPVTHPQEIAAHLRKLFDRVA